MTTLAAALPERREAHEPPEVRGLARDEVRMLVATRDGLVHAQARDLPDQLRAGDLLVVNTSATLPAALPARQADGTQLRLHLSTPDATEQRVVRGRNERGARERWVVELREHGQRFSGGRAGESLQLPKGASATLLAPYLAGARLWLAELDTGSSALLEYLREHGSPIRYGYAAGDWPLSDYQTVFAHEPGSAEMPSAGRPFTTQLVTDLVARGIAIAPITLHTGVSSQEAGEPPYPERFRVPVPTARLVNSAHAAGGRVVAVGTTVVRALETAALPDGRLEPAVGWTRHVVTPAGGVRAVDGLLTGWHEPDASHLLMLEAVGGRALVEDSYCAAAIAGTSSATSTSCSRGADAHLSRRRPARAAGAAAHELVALRACG